MTVVSFASSPTSMKTLVFSSQLIGFPHKVEVSGWKFGWATLLSTLTTTPLGTSLLCFTTSSVQFIWVWWKHLSIADTSSPFCLWMSSEGDVTKCRFADLVVKESQLLVINNALIPDWFVALFERGKNTFSQLATLRLFASYSRARYPLSSSFLNLRRKHRWRWVGFRHNNEESMFRKDIGDVWVCLHTKITQIEKTTGDTNSGLLNQSPVWRAEWEQADTSCY